MEADLDTRLDWVAVNHFNTRHPHSHIVIRGVTDDNKILNVAVDFIAPTSFPRDNGFAHEVHQAQIRRQQWLVEQGLANLDDKAIIFKSDDDHRYG